MLLSKSVIFYNNIKNKFEIILRQEDNKVLINGKFIVAHILVDITTILIKDYKQIDMSPDGRMVMLKKL